MIDHRVSFVLGTALLIAGCSKPAVESYRVPKDPVAQAPAAEPKAPAAVAAPAASAAKASEAPAAPAGNAMASTPVATASGAELRWTAPSHWTSKQGSSMRKGTYLIKADGVPGEAELSITAFPGDVGGDLANLNRWRGQVEQPPIAPAQLESATQRVDRNNLRMTVVDIAGTAQGAPTRILGAMVPHAGSTWFFKLTGPDAIVAKEKPAFITFLDTVKSAPAAK